MTGRTWPGIALIAIGAAVVTSLVGPSGNFPLSDDWSYAYSVRKLCEQGTIEFLPWTGASLILQTLYGAGLCKLFGFSFEVLRVSTLVLAALGVFGFWLLLREARVQTGLALLALIVLALDPLYLNLSFTFMTDVPFAVAAIWSLLFYLRGLKSGRAGALLVGSLIAAAAVLIRQHGIFLGAAAALAALIVEPEGVSATTRMAPVLARGTRMRNAAIAGALPALALAAYFLWIYGSHLSPSGLDNKLREARDFHVLTVLNAAFRGLVTVGLLATPFALLVGRRLWKEDRLRTLTCTAVVGALAVFLFAREQALMFYLPNVLYDLGVGPLTFRDTQFLGLGAPWALGLGFAVPLTIVACATTGVLASLWTGAVRHLREPVTALLVLTTAALFAGSLLHTYYYFDRYLIAVVPPAIAGSAVLCGRIHVARVNVPAWLAAALIGLFAVAGTHDYMAWNRARFEGLSEIGAKGVRPLWVDGGVEYNAWLFAAAMQTWPSDAEARRGQSPDKKSWWWVVHDDYVVSFRELPDYRVYLRKPYNRWLPPGRGEVLILLREKPHVAFVPKP